MALPADTMKLRTLLQVVRAWLTGGILGLVLSILGERSTEAAFPGPGTPDLGFQPRVERALSDGGSGPGMVQCLAIQADGRILVGGSFNRVNGNLRTNLARLNPDGSLDTAFAAGVSAAGVVRALVVRPDGAIWLGGTFTHVDGERRAGLARLRVDGSLDPRFELVPELEGTVGAIALLADDRLMVGGQFKGFALPLRRLQSLVRLRANSVLDDGFSVQLLDFALADRWGEPEVSGIFPQTGGRIVIRVRTPFTMPGDGRLVALLPEGAADWDTFGYYRTPRASLTVVPCRNDRLVVADRGGVGAGAGGYPAIRRLLPSGELDPDFQEWNGFEFSAGVGLADGRVVLAGFEGLFGVEGLANPRNVVRFREDGNADPGFGWGTQVEGKIETVVVLPDGGFLLGGLISGVNGVPLAGLCRLHGGDAVAPVIVKAPQGGTWIAATEAVLEVVATGTEPLSYQWRNAGRDLPGATNPLHRIPDLRSTEAHTYSVQVSNLVGVSTSVVARLNVIAATRVIAGPESLQFRPGDRLSLRVEATGPAPLAYAWYHDGLALGGANTSELIVPMATLADAGDYWAEVSGPGGTAVSSRALLRTWVVQPGDVDPTFAPGTGADRRIVAVAVRPDGKVIVGGTFSNVAGLARSRVALLLTNGTPDVSFEPRVPLDLTVAAVGAVGNGDSLVSGTLGSEFQARGYVGRLNAAGVTVGEAFPGSGLGARVSAVTRQSDDRVVVGGTFRWPASLIHVYDNLARLQAGLQPDTSFPTNLGLQGMVSCVAVDAEDRIVVGGAFTSVQGQPRTAVVRLLASGELDPSFDAGDVRNLTGPGTIHRLALAPDGSVYVVGTFDRVGGHPVRQIARLGNDGAVDAGFSFSLGTTAHEEVRTVCVQPDGWPVFAGRFDPYHAGGITTHVLRTSPAGIVDASFAARVGLSPDVACLAVQPDGKLVVGGDFVVQNPEDQREIVRLLVGESVAPFFVREPEDVLTVPGADALLWAEAGGTRVVGYQWEMDGVPLVGATNRPLVLRQLRPADQGFYTLVATNASGVGRSRAARVRILEVPTVDAISTNRTVVAGDRAVVEVAARGGEPLSYQWTRDGVGLRWIRGPAIVLDPVTAQDAGAYQVTVANDLRAVQSPVSRLKVVDRPRVLVSPFDRTALVGRAVALRVEAVGTGPLSFRWLQDGLPRAAATNAVLELSSVQVADAGTYQVWVTNLWGTATSAPVRLEVVVPPLVVRAPVDQSSLVGGSVTFEVQLAGRPYPVVQWLFEDREILGANAPTLVLTNIQPTQAGSYSVVAGSVAGTTRSASARLVVGEVAPALTEVQLSMLPDGSFVVEARALSGTYQVEVTEDLRAWESVWAGRVDDGRLRFTEPDAWARERRFFRIRFTP